MAEISVPLPDKILNKVINEILMVRKGEKSYFPCELASLAQPLNKLDFELHKRDIEISSDTEYRENAFGPGTDEPIYFSGPVYAGQGVLLGEITYYSVHEQFKYTQYGFKLWLLPENKLALHLFSENSHTTGRISGIGYTGSEETRVIYNTPFRRTVTFRKGEISLEDSLE